MSSPVIVWFRQDLRTEDNPALDAAVESGCPVIPVYIWSPEEEGEWQAGSASRYWLHHALLDLQHHLRGKGSKLILRHGPSIMTLQSLIKENKATKIYWNRCYEPFSIKRDTRIKMTLKETGMEVKSFNSHLLFEPHTIKNKQGKPFKVYTPFWNHYQTLEVPEPLKSPKKLQSPQRWPKSADIREFELVPEIKWYKRISDTWDMSVEGAKKNIKGFIKKHIQYYPEHRNYPAMNGVSLISPYLHFGQASVRSLWHLIHYHEQKQGRISPDKSAQGFLRQLVWREFAHHLIYHFPETTNQPLYEKFRKFPWRKNSKYLSAWQQGRTGYPVVDAGMRELWQTGWMHNRIRMVVASFLTKDLLIPWQEGAKWFWDTLVDADLANNTLGWQWVAGCGADAAPYYRIFNPVTQGERFDPEGKYIRRWVPELSGINNKYIHKPWEAPGKVLSDAGVMLGNTYPQPIIDHAEARERALSYYKQIKN